ncbi:MAG: ROK family protein [Oscillospiraceae bacterium]|jgi:glucokinase|nr:ROK family protein [Oscillospiraceae bacterium]
MYRIGVDLGGTNISVAVVDEGNDYAILGRGQRKTLAPRPAEGIMDDIAAAVRDAVADANIPLAAVASIGVGTPGSVSKGSGMIAFANNLAFHHVPAKAMLEERLGRPVFLDNDANCAALGEALAGSGKGVASFVAITLGTGVGSGIVIDGKIVNGVNDAAGECGHMVINIDGLPCNCGRQGCWERYASATALVEQTRDAMQDHPESLCWQLAEGDLENVNGKIPFDAWRAGDPVGSYVVMQYMRYLAVGLGNLINALQPSMICVGGGIGHEQENLLEPLREMVKKERYSIYAPVQTELVSAALGNDAGIIGAAALYS